MIVALVIGLIAIAWGLTAQARVILVDGVYAILGVALSWMSLRASALISRGTSDRYPYGREALTPLAVLVQGIAALTVLVYAAADAVIVILTGGSDTHPATLAAYGAFTALACLLLPSVLRRLAPGSELVAAEIAHWRNAIWLSVIVALGGISAVLIEPVVGTTLVRYLDPVLVLGACLYLIALPVRLTSASLRELLDAVPHAAIHGPVLAAVATIEREFDLRGPSVRDTKVGRRLYVDIEVLVEPGHWDVSDLDRVRERLHELLDPLGLDLWVGFHPTTTPSLLSD